jgi:hypothetical protein
MIHLSHSIIWFKICNDALSVVILLTHILLASMAVEDIEVCFIVLFHNQKIQSTQLYNKVCQQVEFVIR